MTLKTSPNDINEWLGAKAIRNSDNLKILSGPDRRLARIAWDRGEVYAPQEDQKTTDREA